jgi:urease accessory protein
VNSRHRPFALGGEPAIVGLFAMFHGFAHGAEMPATDSSLDYGVGFLLMTSDLHLCDISFELIAKQWGSWRLVRHVGVAIAACGLYLCFVSGLK